jgi:hypothetical protein
MAGQTISTASGKLYLTSTSNPLTITSTGSVTTTASGDAISAPAGTAWQINNAGTISGVIGTSSAGIYSAASGIAVQNTGKISGYVAGLWLSSGGTVTNGASGLISATGSYGVYIAGAAGVVTNLGTITGSSYAVDLTFSSAANRVVVAPGAVFNGLVSGGNGTLELASGAGSGSITGLNTGSFKNFAALVVDAGASWTLSGSNTIASVTDDGSLVITGALPAATYQIGAAGGGGTLEVASAPSSASPISFLGNSKLIIDSAAGFGANIGNASYSGPLLEGFVSGDTIDIKSFSTVNASYTYNSVTGLLQVVNGSQTASLDFQTSTLGSGAFSLTSDGGTGLDVTLSQATAPAAPTIASPANGSTDTTTAEPVISGGGVSGDTVTISIDGTKVGTALVSNSAWSYTPTSPLSNASHTVTATQAASGGPSSTAAYDTFTVNVSGVGLTISSAVTGPLSLAATNTPLTITGAGSVKATASGADAIDGGSGVAWSINNSGSVASSQRYGISLHGAGSSVVNSGSISGYSGAGGYGLELDAGGTVTNTSTGYITGGEDGIIVNGAAGTINNSGQIVSTFDDGASLFGGGSVINNAGAVIQAPTSGGYGPAAVYIPAGSANVRNAGSMSGQYGVYLGVAGTVWNNGTISGSSSAVDFAASSSANLLEVGPRGTFTGSVNGDGGTIYLTADAAASTGVIGGISNSGQFYGFQSLIADASGIHDSNPWTLTGSNSIANVTVNGGLAISGSLDVTTAVNAASTGAFHLGSGSVLEVAAATGSQTAMDFSGASQLAVDNAALFGTGIGGTSYLGSQLENFGAGDSIDIHNFSASGATLAYDPTSGLLQLANGGELATLDFQQSTLGSGSFHLAADASGSGLSITRV